MTRRAWTRALLAGVVVAALAILAIQVRKDPRKFLPYHYDYHWAVSVYGGPSPLSLAPLPGTKSPLLSPEDVTDVPADFVADPFLFPHADKWWLFIEVLNKKTGQGDIGVASSRDGRSWRYERIVLDEPFHLSYPHVFAHGDDVYMIPESGDAGAVRLYRATDFPSKWQFEGELLRGLHIDPTIWFHDGVWWLFTATTRDNRELSLFFADALKGPWHSHPANPIVRNDATKARPGGRVVRAGGKLLRFGQDCLANYGQSIHAFEIVELSRTSYRERLAAPNAIVSATGQGWNAAGMHQVDAHPLPDGSWLAAVDGYYFERVIGFR